MRKTIFVVLLFSLWWAAFAQGRTAHVFIVVIDGARYTETFGDEAHRYIPNIWNTLRPLGVIYTGFFNDGMTSTNPGHASIVTGAWQVISNDGKTRPAQPTVFEYFRKEKSAPADQTALILGKDKLGILAVSNDENYGQAYAAPVLFAAQSYSDQAAWANLKKAVTASHPALVLVNLPEVDSAGHSGKMESYGAALRQADNIVLGIWNLIQADAHYRDTTTLLVTNDHGRHTTDITDHGDGCEGCRHILLLVIGPDTSAGKVDDERRTSIDIAPTVGALLGFGTPLAKGRPIASALKKSQAVETSR
jgi:predicted AlkP superfamily pyrophosphatase or phosphodiesterase